MASQPPRRGLGQGLSVLLRDQRAIEEGAPAGQLLELDVDAIDPNPRQPRGRLNEEAFAELVASVRRDGVVQPVIVRPHGDRYELIAGERRWRAARAAGLARLPALVRDAGDRESLALALVENVVREQLNAVEQARAYARLADEFGLSQTEIAESVGRSRAGVANAIRLLDLPDDVLDLIEQGSLSEGHGRAVLQVPDHDARRELAQRVATRGLSVREAEAEARRTAPATPRRRPRRGPDWYDPDAANDTVDAIYRAFGLTARMTPDASGCRVEIRLRDPSELARLLDVLGRLSAG